MPGLPSNLENSRARAIALAAGRMGFFGTFFSRLGSLFFLPLWETAQYRLKYCLKGLLDQRQATNQAVADILHFML